MKYLPQDVSEFERMIVGNYIYIDKTELIYNLYATGGRYFFLSRPRRFGKSLLISTMKELFSGNKKLFENLWISRSGLWDWQEYPIVEFDFSRIARRTPEDLEASLTWTVVSIAQAYNLDITDAPTLQDKLVSLVQKLSEHNKVVILIDEYDKPVLDVISDLEIARANQSLLKDFYDTLKGLGRYIHTVFITGVTKFSRTSLFSGLNNLIDITMAPEAAALLGYTKEEIEHYLSEYVAQVAQVKMTSVQAVMQEMEKWYNGYRFSRQETKVYNPFSVLYYLQNKELENYWFASGTPSFLISLLKQQYLRLEDVQDIELSADTLSTFNIEYVPLIPLLFQTGYLTIVDYDAQRRKYKLNYPNLEVYESFTKYIVAALTDNDPASVGSLLSDMVQALNTHTIDLFCELLQSLLAHIPYNLYIKQERYFHSLFQFLGTLLSFEIQSEIVTDRGRIDLVITTQKYIYIFEFKFNTSPDVALRQIEENKYYERYLAARQHIVLIGLAFNYVQDKLTLEWHKKQIR